MVFTEGTRGGIMNIKVESKSGKVLFTKEMRGRIKNIKVESTVGKVVRCRQCSW